MFRSCAFAAPGRHGCQECHKGVPGVLFHLMFSPMFGMPWQYSLHVFFLLSLSLSYVFSGCSCFELLLPGVHRLHFGEGQRHQGDLQWIAIQRLLVYSVWHSANLLGVSAGLRQEEPLGGNCCTVQAGHERPHAKRLRLEVTCFSNSLLLITRVTSQLSKGLSFEVNATSRSL
jgi:hypothetical protein